MSDVRYFQEVQCPLAAAMAAGENDVVAADVAGAEPVAPVDLGCTAGLSGLGACFTGWAELMCILCLFRSGAFDKRSMSIVGLFGDN